VGIALWIVSGAAAFFASRAIAAGRRKQYASEIVLVPVVSFAAGLVATALDFGGWRELDWRAGLFAFCCTMTAIAAFRALRLLMQRAGQH
jgi:hypothetical protein